jgi:hypothetical protein
MVLRRLIFTCFAIQLYFPFVWSEVVKPNQVPRSGRVNESASIESTLANLGFKCETASSGRQMCRGKVDAYPEPIRIFIPKNGRPGSRLVLHFHGNNIGPGGPRDSSFHFKNGSGDFGSWLDDASSNDVLVVPESLGETRTYDTLFKREALKDTAKNFSLLIGGLEDLLGSRITEIAISGHSAGYRAIGALGLARAAHPDSDLGRVSSVALFDAVYGRTNEVVSWLPHIKNRAGVFYCIYAQNGGTVTSGPGDQRSLNYWFKKNEGLIPVPHASDKAVSALSVMTTTADHMDVLKDTRYTDFLRLLQNDKLRKK